MRIRMIKPFSPDSNNRNWNIQKRMQPTYFKKKKPANYHLLRWIAAELQATGEYCRCWLSTEIPVVLVGRHPDKSLKVE